MKDKQVYGGALLLKTTWDKHIARIEEKRRNESKKQKLEERKKSQNKMGIGDLVKIKQIEQGII